MTSVQMSEIKSHCIPLTEEIDKLKQKFPRKNQRFSKAARRSQILFTLTACGPNSMRGLAQIISSYTDEEPEIVRRILYRHIKLLTDLWFVEKKNAKLRITPLGLYVLTDLADKADVDPYGYMSLWIASRLEEWEPALRGLRALLEALKYIIQLEYDYVFDEILSIVETGKLPRPRAPREDFLDNLLELSESEYLFLLLNHGEIKSLGEDDPVMVLHSFSHVFAPCFVGTYLYELRKDLPEEFERALMRHDARLRKIASLLRICSYEGCPDKALDILLEDLFDSKGLLWHVERLDVGFVEKMTGWPEGKPNVESALAIMVAGKLLSDSEVDSLILALKKAEDELGEFLATLLVVYALDQFWGKLSELSRDIAAVSRFKSSVIPRVWSVRDPRYRDLLSAILMLDKVLNDQLELSRKGGDAGA